MYDTAEAEFNLAVGTVLRINDELNKLNYAFQAKDYALAFESLRVVFSEVSPFIKKDKEELYDKEVEREHKLELAIAGHYKIAKGRNSVFYPSAELDHELRAWDRDLRFYMLKYKLYMKMADNRLAAAKI